MTVPIYGLIYDKNTIYQLLYFVDGGITRKGHEVYYLSVDEVYNNHYEILNTDCKFIIDSIIKSKDIIDINEYV